MHIYDVEKKWQSIRLNGNVLFEEREINGNNTDMRRVTTINGNNTDMRRVTTFRSTTDRIHDCGPIRL